MLISENQIRKILLSEFNISHSPDTEEYIAELDALIDSIRVLKNSLRSGPDRLKHRKEMGKLQGAITAIRFLRGKCQRALEIKILSERGNTLPEDSESDISRLCELAGISEK